MKGKLLSIIFTILTVYLYAQESRIENTRVKLSLTADSLIVNYDLSGKKKAFDVKLEVFEQNQQPLKLNNVFGDIGNNIQPGKNKTIIWDITSCKMDLHGKTLSMNVTGKVFNPARTKKEIWIPWLYIAAGACATTGTYFDIRANKIYNTYTSSSITDEAEKLHREVVITENIRDVFFLSAGIFGVAGVIVHINHLKQKKELILSYKHFNNEVILGLTCNF